MDEAIDFFRALGDRERLRIINLLLSRSKEACICELVDALRLPQNHVLRQLGVLRRTGLMTVHRRGSWSYYAISPNLSPLAKKLLQGVSLDFESQTLSEDGRRFEKRLRLRRGRRCVIGFEPGQPFRHDIPAVQTQTSRATTIAE